MNNQITALENHMNEELVSFNLTDNDVNLIGFARVSELRQGPATPTGVTLVELHMPIHETPKLAFSVNDREMLILKHKKTGQMFDIEACIDHFVVTLNGGKTLKIKHGRFLLSDAERDSFEDRDPTPSLSVLEQERIGETALMQFSTNKWKQLVVKHKLTEDVFVVDDHGSYFLISLRAGDGLKVGRSGFTVMKK